MRRRVITAIVKKEFIQIVRDRRSLLMTFMLPLMMMILYSYGVRFDVKSIHLAISDMDNSYHSRELIRSFTSSGYFERVGGNLSSRKAQNLILSGNASAALIIPPDFTRNLKRKRVNLVQIILDGIDNNTANISQGYIKAIVLQHNSKLIANNIKTITAVTGLRYPPINASIRIWYNPELKSNQFIIPGIIVIIMMLMGAMLTALAIVREKETGSFENIISSPIKSGEFIMGKILPYTILAFLDMILVIVVGWLVFHVPVKGSVLLLLICSVVYLMSTLGTGILISTIAKTQQVALLGAMLVTLLPSILFSGFIFPIRNMPLVLQWLCSLVPAKYFMVVVRSIYLKATGLESFWSDMAILMLLTALLLIISAKKFRKSLD